MFFVLIYNQYNVPMSMNKFMLNNGIVIVLYTTFSYGVYL